MQAKEIQFTSPEFPTELLDRLIFALEGRRKQMYVVEKPMTATEIRVHLGNMGASTFYRAVKAGGINAHYIPGCKTPFYFLSEAYETLKHN